MVLVSSYSFCQGLTDSEIKIKLDSILAEGNLLFRYEKAVWVASDLGKENAQLKDFTGETLAYQDQNKIVVALLNKEKECLATYSFENPSSQPNYQQNTRKLNQDELKLYNIKSKIIDEISKEKYRITAYENYGLNLVLIPEKNSYKLYIVNGTSLRNVIPFGNDYLFETDAEGNIIKWKKFHSRLIADKTALPDGGKATRLTHSHLKTTPFITATDICTFKLYAESNGQNEFQVYAGGHYYSYNLKNDTLELVKE